MILFTILLLMFIILTAITILAISIGGSIFVVIFGDVIICILLIVQIMKHLRKKNKKK